jgi:hypothetical protein
MTPFFIVTAVKTSNLTSGPDFGLAMRETRIPTTSEVKSGREITSGRGGEGRGCGGEYVNT